MVKVGDIVKVKVSKYKLRGTVVEIEDNVAKIEVPTYYGSALPVVVYKDINFLHRVPETLKELEDLKKGQMK